MKKVICATISFVFALMPGWAATQTETATQAGVTATRVGAVTRVECRVDTARGVIVIPAVEGGADVAVAVVDKRIGTPDTLTTIASQLLLQSDLRGHVEDAAWYLRAPAHEAVPAADALMLTQGWTRYDIPAAIRGDMADSLAFPIEIGAQLDGVIRSKWRGKPLAGVTANVLAPRMADGASATTDSLGRFSITGLEWPDSTWLVVSAMNAKGKLEENIHPDFDSFPAITSLPEDESFISTLPAPASDDEGWDDYVARLNASPQGMQITLKEVVVRGMRNRDATNAIDFLASVYIRPGQDESIRTYEDAVTHIPGVNVINDRLMYHTKPVDVWVDGRYLGCATPDDNGGDNVWSSGATNLSNYAATLGRMALDDSDMYDTGLLTNKLRIVDLEEMYPFRDNESIAFFPPYLAMFFSKGALREGATYRHSAGVLNITTKNPGKLKHTLSPEFHAIMPLGYQKPCQFYIHKYDLNNNFEVNQSGAIIYWIPSIDLSHEIQLSLPAFINSSDISVYIEGLKSHQILIGM
ncbi:carboxypeptidase-like regulatory domain-containing protein [uncultured Muribaculum sp.]|uniref:carboxypeptidase-like regulatory domain-containing protein n=1 Tax=uncultured Muribaculum sp. TaxID=1918613 RepID=UPI0025F65D88|nr:carboxypeptidase-like regulatory domain-containing protein [uncultured Muribaculum sp.]